MTITRDEVKKIAELARLEIPEARIERMAGELSAVLDFAGALQRLDLEGCEPSVFAPADAPLREDALDDRRLSQSAALAAAPEAEQGFFLVPPIVENLAP
ncbi:MAG TPA: Asp-tRNA(Asn)/Glu-tRNA(Gln) amidotransferase subunit GatC [Candidatus Eisenbacteria bacterium]|nr:Asp-tRNA(Asn)/Glu-tRNA(Gln) amidotransferase subunit GatC [Candidatus Eisenbacteria bacterium]